jgi:hypothetical protein
MFIDYQNDVIRAYRQKQASGDLPDNLKRVITANLKAESAFVCAKRYSCQDERTLARYFEVSTDQQGYLDLINDRDADDFKSVYKFLRGETRKPNEEIVEMLAWLIDFQPRPYLKWVDQQPGKEEDKEEDKKERGKEKIITLPKPDRTGLSKKLKVVISFAMTIAVCMTVYILWPKTPADAGTKPTAIVIHHGKCMYWAGEQFKMGTYEVTHNDTPAFPVDTTLLANFRRITDLHTLSKHSIRRVWYAKINGQLEIFNQPGFHPVDTARRLLPLTAYMFNKYIAPGLK